MMRGLRALILALAVLCLGAPGRAADGAFLIPETDIIKAMQAAVRADDKDWFVKHLHYPVRYYGETLHMIRSKDWFLKHYATIIGPKLKEEILAQDPEHYLKNYQGLMVGEGSHNIWLEEFGDPGSPDIGTNYQIITINNSDR
ncbi:MAG TPA: hypothetical protein VF340_00795 [Methyloceanibacter sp.]|jgi:hypothetical protein